MSTATDAVARNLAAAFLDGEWSADALRQRGGQAVGRRGRWLAGLVRRVLEAFPAPGRPDALARFVAADRPFRAACAAHFRRSEMPLRRLFWVAPRMAPADGPPSAWPVPALATTGALADWLGLTPGQLDWFADCRGLEARAPEGPLRHYTYRWLVSSGGRRRLLESPRPRLKALQRQVLHKILDRIPAHDAAHGYRPGRSVVSYAGPHAGKRVVLRLDLRQFFPSVRAARVQSVFRTAGYPPDVARALTGLCTNAAPPDVCAETALPARARYRSAHLPQGAPTSPALANLCAYRLDCRLAGLARRFGAAYTRYADDLAFSGGEELESSARRFHAAVCLIALEEGFEVHAAKTRLMRRSVRQSLAGVVVNERPNGRREEFERLKATLYNCVKHGPAGQNRDGAADFRAHLAGKIAHQAQLNAGRGRRLRELFERIDWGA